ncbi:MAG: 16S rRNA (guanine(966)-N(2))-methyltransferase RsmD [Lachnospiraceae bacterium]|nr:16S rRNA (guanine(966)-N(2))-methyltransferase RsmD [Lachnospiraceae bacterium]
MLRVIAGSARSLQLKTPPGDGTRPTTDRIKETLFNVLQTEVPDAVFVDLFAGSGAMGIEALSRGAKKAYFFESDKTAVDCIEENLKHTKLFDRGVVFKQDAVGALNYGVREAADIVFADPPYGKGYDEMLLEAASRSRAVTEDTIIVIEEEKKRDFSFAAGYGFDIIKEKVYKSNKHVFLKRSDSK